MGLLASVLDLPGTRCACCRTAAGPLCGPCSRLLEPARVAAPVAGAAGVAVPYRYHGPARDLVLALKLRGDASCAVPLVEGLVNQVRRLGIGAEAVTWVPARRRDVVVRGTDHAKVLAVGLARRVGVPARPLLTRTRQGVADQAGLGASDRSRNLEGAFMGSGCPPVVLLVDDLITTGATARACVSALISGGASQVWVAAACRADPPTPRVAPRD